MVTFRFLKFVWPSRAVAAMVMRPDLSFAPGFGRRLVMVGRVFLSRAPTAAAASTRPCPKAPSLPRGPRSTAVDSILSWISVFERPWLERSPAMPATTGDDMLVPFLHP